MTALRYCLNVAGEHSIIAFKEDRQTWHDVIKTSQTLCKQTIKSALQVLGGRVHDDEGSAPSFEQMGVAIQELIRESRGENDYNNSDVDGCFSLTLDHQVLMSWAWISIKVSFFQIFGFF